MSNSVTVKAILIVGRSVVALIGVGIASLMGFSAVLSLTGSGWLVAGGFALAAAVAFVGAVAGAAGRAWGAALVAIASGALVVFLDMTTSADNRNPYLAAATVVCVLVALGLWRAGPAADPQ